MNRSAANTTQSASGATPLDTLVPEDRLMMLEIARLAVRLYAETHPRPTQVNQQQAAEMLGLSHVTVRKLIRSGAIKMNAAGLIPIEEVDQVRAARGN